MTVEFDHIARTFFDAEHDGKSWDEAPEDLKAEFRMYARDAIAWLEEHRHQKPIADFEVTSGEAAKAA